MSTSTLSLTVQTVDNQVLLPVGTELSTEALDAVVSSNKTATYQNCSLMQYDTIREDLLKFLRVHPYQAIFPAQEDIADLLNDMETVCLDAPILQSICYFKERDPYSYHHFLVVFALSTLLAKDLIFDYNERMNLASTGPVHDIGKIYVPLNILQKSTPLTRAEKRILDEHTTAGYVLLSYYSRNTQTLACRVARDHHERMDGSGYPSGSNLRDPMIEIIIVCDVYDALVSPRPYRRASYDNRTALEEITGMAERGQLSWDVVKALVAHNRQSKPHYSETSIPTEVRGTPPVDNLYGIIAEEESDN